MPYVAYQVDDIRVVETETVPRFACRIRYWVGLINHFSFFWPQYGDIAGGYDLPDLPTECWDSGSGSAGLIGARVKWWMSMVESLAVHVSWEGGDSGKLWPCDPWDLHDPSIRFPSDDPSFFYTYDQTAGSIGEFGGSGVGDATPHCFSDKNAYDYLNNTATEPISLLGALVRGEVCMLPQSDRFDLETTVREGFEMLFGSRVVLSYQVRRWLPETSDVSSVQRNICVSADDLEMWQELRTRVEVLRAGDHGKWLFRSWDANVIEYDASGITAWRDPCGC